MRLGHEGEQFIIYWVTGSSTSKIQEVLGAMYSNQWIANQFQNQIDQRSSTNVHRLEFRIQSGNVVRAT